MTHSLGSAERPASESSDPNAARPVQPAQYMTVDDSPPSGYSESHKLAFYNIGWDRKSKKAWHTADGLATEICDMVHDKGIDAALNPCPRLLPERTGTALAEQTFSLPMATQLGDHASPGHFSHVLARFLP